MQNPPPLLLACLLTSLVGCGAPAFPTQPPPRSELRPSAVLLRIGQISQMSELLRAPSEDPETLEELLEEADDAERAVALEALLRGRLAALESAHSTQARLARRLEDAETELAREREAAERRARAALERTALERAAAERAAAERAAASSDDDDWDDDDVDAREADGGRDGGEQEDTDEDWDDDDWDDDAGDEDWDDDDDWDDDAGDDDDDWEDDDDWDDGDEGDDDWEDEGWDDEDRAASSRGKTKDARARRRARRAAARARRARAARRRRHRHAWRQGSRHAGAGRRARPRARDEDRPPASSRRAARRTDDREERAERRAEERAERREQRRARRAQRRTQRREPAPRERDYVIERDDGPLDEDPRVARLERRVRAAREELAESRRAIEEQHRALARLARRHERAHLSDALRAELEFAVLWAAWRAAHPSAADLAERFTETHGAAGDLLALAWMIRGELAHEEQLRDESLTAFRFGMNRIGEPIYAYALWRTAAVHLDAGDELAARESLLAVERAGCEASAHELVRQLAYDAAATLEHGVREDGRGILRPETCPTQTEAEGWRPPE